MPIVTIEISDDEIVAGVPGRDVRQVTRNLIAVRARKIYAIGANAENALALVPPAPNSTMYVGRAVDAERLNVDYTNATLKYLTARVLGLAYPGWRILLRMPEYQIRWTAWGSIRVEDRMAILQFLFCQRADVNGATVIRPRIDLPIIRLFVGTRISATGL
jgi:hypothetical protein